jgi:dihydroorotase
MKDNKLCNFDLVGGRLVDPYSGINRVHDLFIRDGIIYYSAPEGKAAEHSFSVENHVILPGLLDIRVHNRVPGDTQSETVESLTKAAAKGGFSSILAMPNTKPHSDNPGTIRYIQDRINQTSKIKVHLTGCLTIESKGKRLAPLGSLKEAGVIAVTDCPQSVGDNQIFANAIKYAKMFGLKIIEYPQDPYLSIDGEAHESPLSLKMGLPGNPRMAEELVVQRAITLSRHLEVPIHISSISSIGSVKLIKEAKESNVKITTDVSAHHLLLTEQAISHYNTQAKTTPPLREETDRQALINGLKDGTIDACNSSHEPFADHLKQVEFDLAPSGVIGLETALMVVIEAISQKDPFSLIAEKMSTNPHRILGLEAPSLKEGKLADLVVINPELNWTYEPMYGMSLSQNSPLGRHKFIGRPILTVSCGKIAMSESFV